MKKVVLVCGMVLALFSMGACNGGEEAATGSDLTVAKEGFPIVDEKLEMSFFAPNVGSSSFDKMALMTDYSDMSNVFWTYTTPPDADLATKLNLAFASGDIQDVLFASKLTKVQEIQYGGNTLLPLDEYIDGGYAPNIKKILDAFPELRNSLTTPDGHIYSLPMLSGKYNIEDAEFASQSVFPSGPIWYNGEWLDNLGVTELPKTTDEFYDLLVRFRDEDPNGNGQQDEVPLSSSKITSLRPWMMWAFGVLQQEQQVIDDQVSYGAATENYRAYLEYMNKLYSDNLLDAEVFSQSDDQKKAKGNNNQLGAFTDWFSFFTTNRTQEDAVNDPMFQPLTSPESPETVVSTTDGVSTGAFAITSQAANPEAAIRWVDYFYSDEGSRYLNTGPDEEKGGYWHWETNDSGEEVRVRNEGITADNAEEERSKVTPDYGTVPPKVASAPAIVLGDKNDSNEADAFQQFVNQETAEKTGPYEVVGWPTLYISKEEQDELGSSLQADLLSYVEQMEAKFITGQETLNDASWQNYLDTLSSIGVEKFVDVHQRAYDRWNNQ
ncbi:extracellular solute-binding protein [Enterococcus sp. LJL120]